MHLTELDDDPASPFPPVERALREPDGLLAWGGDLSVPRLLNAYRHGCFPWFSEGQPLLWWAPDPRMVLPSDGFHVSRSLRRFLRRSDWTLRADCRFDAVISHCADTPRRGQDGTWILPSMATAYRRMHARGHAHSVEVYDRDDCLVGGIYGIAIGRMFFGESMFSLSDNGSKVALLGLCRFLHRNAMPMLDCQMHTAHLESLGARTLPRERFIRESRALCALPGPPGSWQDGFGHVTAAGLSDSEPR
ncbi:leucyl/phenylalanyl-tRNA--protein transferase [Pseudofulvimonas gallinarii]|jgi:leucyl/phenylalanyl-tRNA--protein transferase|uniref:Leucyl/phenylalanyl-tRNA--protein transferase n=1 Tax=Pseudofulvimonas gallinarii TaxID=634155 RepID=A0A4S3KZ94_9GAMM|nr:leucyl/phenylalanyl-tRNA--protein transferase [Pseudofulvimonas gallinarii]TCS96355.1 leucyl/phenylalanyl-tRNA--protein transferase [Pseudofulvimonas gallinarii]THD14735.1 leucyl/phenylalanyl-tRNA--protein transferase [Pseudofulvimonas gallinarii]